MAPSPNVVQPPLDPVASNPWTPEETEAVFQSQFNSSHVGIVVTAADRRWLHVNQRFCEIVGYNESELHARSWAELTHPDDAARDIAGIGRMLTGESEAYDIDKRYVRKDGSVVWARTTVAVYRNADRSVRFFVATIRDISERVLALERLQQTRDTLYNVLDSVPQSIFWKDRDGVYLGCNRQFARNVGAGEAASVIGRTDYDLLSSRERADGFRTDDLEVMESGQARRNLIRSGLRSDGSWFWSDTTKIPLRDHTGRVTGVLGVHADITDRVRAEQDRLEIERRLLHAQKLESLGVLAGGIAHDFNNLLMAVLGNLDLAAQQVSTASPALSSIEQAIQATRRASDLTRQMLAYSGRGQFVVARMDLREVVRENSDLFKVSISKTVKLELEESSAKAVMDGDPGQIQQIVMNLITNASDAIGERAGVIRLESGVIDCTDEYLSQSRLAERPAAGRYAYIEVSDNGQGMDDATQQRLFDPFFTTKFTGRGLGMSAVLGIVRGHKGAIIVNSAPGAGTAIRVLFPAGEEPPVTASEPDEVPRAEPARATRPRTVLVVDDEAAVRRLCVTFVERLGHHCVAAEDGEEAVNIFKARAAEIDCVLLDLTMPRMDGVSAFRALREIRPDIRVVLSSGYAEQDATQRFGGERPTGFIQKPFRLQDFNKVLDEALAGLD